MEMQSHKITVEALQIQDLHWFVDVAATRMLMEELKRPELHNREHMFMLVSKGMNEGTAWVAKKDGECIGALGSLLFPNVLNPEIYTLVELVWYVLPEYRNTRAGVLLLNTLDEKGREVANETTLSLLPTSVINLKTLEKRGYMLEEYGFRKGNKQWQY